MIRHADSNHLLESGAYCCYSPDERAVLYLGGGGGGYLSELKQVMSR